MTEAVQRTIAIILHAGRPLPAHFCLDESKGLNGTFMINFESLTQEDDQEMAHQSYYSLHRLVRYDSSPDPSLYYGALRMGENLMAGMFILTLLGEPYNQPSLYAALLQETTDRLAEHGIADTSWIDSPDVRNYFQECVRYGEQRGRARFLNGSTQQIIKEHPSAQNPNL